MNRSEIVFKVLGMRYGFDLQKMVKFVNDNQYWSLDQIEAYQLKQLQKIINHAYHKVPYYNKNMKALGMLPEDIKSLQDILNFPVIDKQTVLENVNDFMSQDFSSHRPMERSTGGTTGIPFKYYNDTYSWGLNWATKIRAFTWGGYHLGKDRIAILKGGSMYNQGRMDLKSKAWRWLQKNYSFNIMNMTDVSMSLYAKDIADRKIEYIRGYPTAISSFAQWVQKHKINLKMKRIFTTAEMLLPHQRALIQEVFQCKIIDTYGCGDGMGGASQCKLSQKYHINVETSLMEILDANLKDAAKPGQIGEIVLTSLHDYAMPFIRYTPGDQAILSSSSCSCDIKLPTLDKIIGRTSDVFHLPNGRTINGLSIPLESWTDKVSKFQIIHEKESLIVVKLIVKDTYSNIDEKAILDIMNFNAGEGIDIEVHVVDDIPPTKAGKHKYVISKVNK